jgi:hypothetical protein
MQELSGPRAGRRRRRQHEIPAVRRVGAWLVWWVLLMSPARFGGSSDEGVTRRVLLIGDRAWLFRLTS